MVGSCPRVVRIRMPHAETSDRIASEHTDDTGTRGAANLAGSTPARCLEFGTRSRPGLRSCKDPRGPIDRWKDLCAIWS